MKALKYWAGLTFVAFSLMANAQSPTTKASQPNKNAEVPLWANAAPGAVGSAAVDIPTLTTYLPASNPTHTAVIVVPGGGYEHLALDHEGAQIAAWLNKLGIAAFVLKYRLGPTYHHPIELGDAQRALQTVRAHAAEYSVDKNHIGMWGFSAGGHLTSTVGTHFTAGNPESTDKVERESTRPDFMILAYPVITMISPTTDSGSALNLLGASPAPATLDLLSNEKQVTPQTPPTFIFSTTDDNAVPVLNSVLFYTALIQNHVPAEMHLYRHGRHGLGLAQSDVDLKVWPTLLQSWLVANGWAQATAVK